MKHYGKDFDLWCESNADEAEFWAQYDVELVARGVDSGDISDLNCYYNGQFFQIEFGPGLDWWNVFYPTNQHLSKARRSMDELYSIALRYPGYDGKLAVYGYIGRMWDKYWKPPAMSPWKDIDWRDEEVMAKFPPHTVPRRGNS